MAVNILRSMNSELREGATDGKYRKARPNTTAAPGLGDEIVAAERSTLHPFHGYGFINSETPDQARVTNTKF